MTSLADHIAAVKRSCLCCDILARMTEQDREDFTAAVAGGLRGRPLSRAINSRLAELGIDKRIGDTAVGNHIERGCSPS